MPNASSARRLLAPAVLLVFGVAYSAAQWSMQPGQSKLTFVATQAGAKFEGAFEQFSADIHFDPDDPGAGRFDVVIDLNSVNSRDRERDEVIAGPDMLDAAQWPTARYVVQGFTAIGGGKYRGAGRLTLRNVTRETPIEFTFKRDGDVAWLVGGARLKRLDFGVGQGEWRDTEWVGDEVEVRFSLKLAGAGR
ncbi:MAG TPA: YceI family protein [Steroidobacter sp.]|jgi:polyisoprenoid-binding protein YceI|nr:YceI family protein [Steroidobacteraceae bacterium]HLS81961.1 YceI family protein [Steroidobacter sp.]